jgi:hypothetical protein
MPPPVECEVAERAGAPASGNRGRGDRLGPWCGRVFPRADFVFNNGQEVTSLDPAAITGQPEMRVLHALFEGLTVKDPVTLEPMPAVAESWDVSPDGLHYTFHLRQARWSNGRPADGHGLRVVVAAPAGPRDGGPVRLPALVRPGGPRVLAGRARDRGRWAAVGLETPDPRTLEVELERPTPYFLALTSSPPLFPGAPRQPGGGAEALPGLVAEPVAAAGNLVSNGPFRLFERRSTTACGWCATTTTGTRPTGVREHGRALHRAPRDRAEPLPRGRDRLDRARAHERRPRCSRATTSGPRPTSPRTSTA